MPSNYDYSGIRHYSPSLGLGLKLDTGLGTLRDVTNLHNGNLVLDVLDFALPFYNSPLMLKRYFNSRCDIVGMFGYGWHSNWEMKIIVSGNNRYFIDATGAQWLFTWNGTAYVRPAGLFATLEYANSIYTLTNMHDKSVATFDASGNLTSLENSIGVLHTVTRVAGHITKIESCHIEESGMPVRRSVEFSYDGDLVISVKENLESLEIRYEYSGNFLNKVIYPNQMTMFFAQDAPLTYFYVFDTSAREWQYQFANDKVYQKVIPDGTHPFTFTYNVNQTVVTDGRNKNWTHNFNVNGCRTSLVTPRSKTYSWTYNSDNQILTHVLPGAITAVTNTYNVNGTIATTTDALSKQYGFTWDQNDLLTTITDPDSNTISFTYNNLRQIATVTNQESETTGYDYSTLGAIETVTDPKGFITKFENNVYGQAVKTIDPLGQQSEVTYDIASMVPVALIGKNARTTSFAYDANKRLLSKTFPSGQHVDYTWCGHSIGRIACRAYEKDVPAAFLDYLVYTYDKNGRVLTIDNVAGGMTSYSYDGVGNISTVYGKDGQLRSYTYDDDGNLTLSSIEATSYAFLVDDRGWRTRITYPNNWYADIAYNNRGQITIIDLKNASNVLQHRISYGYDNLALVSQIYNYNDASGTTYGETSFKRDDIGRILTETREATGYGTDYLLNLSYDANSNLLGITNKSNEGLHMNYDALNRLVCYKDDTAGSTGIFSYNSQGLLKAQEVAGAITKFSYDANGVLTGITDTNGDTHTFDFDLLGHLRGYDDGTRESVFAHNGSARLADYNNATESWRGYYHWCRTKFLGYVDDSANTYYILPDANGSTAVIFTPTAVVNRIEYDCLGKIRQQTTTPQVELGWKTGMNLTGLPDYVINCSKIIHNTQNGRAFEIGHQSPAAMAFGPSTWDITQANCSEHILPRSSACATWFVNDIMFYEVLFTASTIGSILALQSTLSLLLVGGGAFIIGALEYSVGLLTQIKATLSARMNENCGFAIACIRSGYVSLHRDPNVRNFTPTPLPSQGGTQHAS